MTYLSRAVRFSWTLIGGTDERFIFRPSVILLSFGVCFAGEGVAEGAPEIEVDSLAAGSDSELASSEDDAPLPNRPFSFPISEGLRQRVANLTSQQSPTCERIILDFSKGNSLLNRNKT